LLFINYDILKDKIYLHLPLQRFLGLLFKNVMQSMNHGLENQLSNHSSSSLMTLNENMLNIISKYNKVFLGLVLTESPLRAFAFSVHAYAGLWSRNGNGVMNQAMNYRNAPFCYQFRDLDLSAMQFGNLFLGSQYFIKLSLFRFGIYDWCQDEFKKNNDIYLTKFMNSLSQDDASTSTSHVLQQDLKCLEAFFDLQPSKSCVREEAVPHVLAEVLLLYVNMITETPLLVTPSSSSPSSSSSSSSLDEGSNKHISLLNAKVRRALIHAVSHGGSKGLKHSKANEIVHKLCGSDETLIDVPKILSQICAKNQTSQSSQLLYLSDSVSYEYDPSYENLYYLREHEQASDYIATLRQVYYKKNENNMLNNKEKKNDNEKKNIQIALVSKLSKTQEHLELMRDDFLLNNIFIKFLIHMSLRRRFSDKIIQEDDKKKNKNKNASTIRDGDRPCCLSLHVLTLMTHAILNVTSNEKEDISPSSSPSSLSSFMHESIASMKIDENKQTAINSFFHWLTGTDTDHNNNTDNNNTMMDSNNKDKDDVVNKTSPLWLLGLLWLECYNDQSALPSLHRMGLNWILSKLGETNMNTASMLRCFAIAHNNIPIPGAAAVVTKANKNDENGSGSGGGGDKSPGQLSMADRKAAAQKRAMEAMKKSQAAFTKHLETENTSDQKKLKSKNNNINGIDDDISDNSDSDDDNGKDGNGGHGGGLQCVICRSSGNGSLAYMGFAQRSNMLATSITHDTYKKTNKMKKEDLTSSSFDMDGHEFELSNRWPKELEEYVVVSPTGCQMDEHEGLGSSSIGVLSKGTLLGPLLQVKNNRAQVAINITLNQGTESGNEMIIDHENGLNGGGGEPLIGWINIRTPKGRQQISPLRHQHAWQRWGKSRLHVSSCGHGVHLPCWDAYFARVLSTPSRGEFESAFHDRREFHCPLCKSLSNLLIPHYKPIDEEEGGTLNEETSSTSSSPSSKVIRDNEGNENSITKFPKIDSSTSSNAPSSLNSSSPLFDLIEWKKNNGIFYSNQNISYQYCFNDENHSNEKDILQSSSSFIINENDKNVINIFHDMLCETAINHKDLNHIGDVKIKNNNSFFRSHEAYSSFAYTLQCLEISTRDSFQFPKVGVGCDADCLQSYIGLLQRISRTKEVKPMACCLRERLIGNIIPLLFQPNNNLPNPLSPEHSSSSSSSPSSDSKVSSNLGQNQLDVMIHSQFSVVDDMHIGVGGVGGSLSLGLSSDGFPCASMDLIRKKLIEEFIEQKNKKAAAAASSETNIDNVKDIDPSWTCWAQPVLAWDLYTYTVTVLTSTVPPSLQIKPSSSTTTTKNTFSDESNRINDYFQQDRLKLIKMLILLKLCQILIEPEILKSKVNTSSTTTTYNTNADENNNDNNNGLSLLRQKLSKIINYEIDETKALYGDSLLNIVQEKLSPFIIYILMMKSLLTPLSQGQNNADRLWEVLSLDRDDMETLLSLAGLPNTLNDIANDSEIFISVFKPWAEQYAAFYQPQSNSIHNTQPQSQSMQKCGWCGKIDRCLKCTGCFELQYCSRECQKSHWLKGHRSFCSALGGTSIKAASWGGPNFLSSLSGFNHPMSTGFLSTTTTTVASSSFSTTSDSSSSSDGNLKTIQSLPSKSSDQKSASVNYSFISDESHFSTSLSINPTLFKLPHHYHDIYTMVAPHLDQLALDVNGTNSDSIQSAAEQKDPPEVAICLITGTILPAGAKLDGN